MTAITLDTNRLCDEVGEALKRCPTKVIARIATEVIEQVSGEDASVSYVGDEDFKIECPVPE